MWLVIVMASDRNDDRSLDLTRDLRKPSWIVAWVAWKLLPNFFCIPLTERHCWNSRVLRLDSDCSSFSPKDTSYI